tara:strand:+ start:1651 stop:1872 length:222 start_codon:yes stop_codon:yes gene_type:complete
MDLNAVYTIIVTCALTQPVDLMGNNASAMDRMRIEYTFLENDDVKKKKKKKKKLAEKGKKKKKGFFSKVFGSK